MVKLSLKTPLRHAGKAEIQPYSTLHSALDGSEWSISQPGRFTLGQRFPTFLTRGALFRINFHGGAP